MNYICKPTNAKVPVITEVHTINHPRIRKIDRVVPLDGFGDVNIMKDTGKLDNARFEIGTKRAGWLQVEASREGVKSKLRRVRPEEQAMLDAIDEKIHALHEQKNELLKLAWSKAHVVTVKELESMVISK